MHLSRSRRALGQFLRFAVVGGGSGVVNVVLYVLLRTWWPPLAANLVALAVATVANTEANRRITFTTDADSWRRTHVKGLLSFALYYAFTSGALLALHQAVRDPSHATEAVVLLLASVTGTGGRFLFLRSLLR